MAKDRFAPKQLNDIMGDLGGRLASYASKSQSLGEHQALLNQCVGSTLAQKCRIGNYRDGTLVVEAASATVAMKLNYIKMDILSAFRAAGMAELCLIKIVTTPQAAGALAPRKREQSKSATKPGQGMSEQTAAALEEVAASAPPSLQEKLRKLARHGRRGTKA